MRTAILFHKRGKNGKMELSFAYISLSSSESSKDFFKLLSKLLLMKSSASVQPRTEWS